MAQLQEVSVDDLKHLVSNRAIEGETMLLNMGPLTNLNWPPCSPGTSAPVRSFGFSVGCPDILPMLTPDIDAARALAARVFPSPGTDSSKRCPLAMMVMTIRSRTGSCPFITRPMFSRRALLSSSALFKSTPVPPLSSNTVSARHPRRVRSRARFCMGNILKNHGNNNP